jgi:beta-lactam-binding protein with PASTA domain
MLAGRWPGWLLLLLTTASATALVATPSANAQTRPVSPTTRPATTAPSVVRPTIDPTVRLARGCAPLPELTGRQVDEVLPTLNPKLFRPRVNAESSSQPRGTILRQPTAQLVEGRLCDLDIAVSDGSLTRVPQLRGATAEEAQRALAAADLRISTREKSSGEPADRIFDQKPDAGAEVPRGSTVVAIIAIATERISPADAAAEAIAAAIAAARRDAATRPPEPEPAEETCLALPELAGRSLDDVLPTLGRRYFRPRVSEEPSTEPRGTILRQPTTEPIDGSLCYVDIAISDGSLTRVPPLYGATTEEAGRALADAELRIAIRESVSSEPEGRVFDQKPRAGAEVRRGSTVAAVIALPELFVVPAVVGRTYEEALAQLERFAVTRTRVASRRPNGEVTDQEPRPPAQRPAGAEVRLEVSDGSLVLVPPVENQTLDSARAAFGEVDLRAEVEEQEGDLAPGLVATQEPAGGTEVARGSTVRTVVSTGLPVPDVVGQPQADAATLLGRFEVQQSSIQSRQPEGEVIDQDPRPPARAAAGSVVRVTVSDGSRVLVPPVEGEALASARGALAEAGLAAEVEEQQGEIEAGLVATQEPAGGAEVARGSTVRLVVSTGPRPPEVVDTPTEPPTDGSGPVVTDDGDGSEWPRWPAYVLALLAGGGLFYALRLRLRPPPAEPHVSARLESDPDSVTTTDVDVAAPQLHVSARLDAGDCQVRLEGDSP